MLADEPKFRAGVNQKKWQGRDYSGLTSDLW